MITSFDTTAASAPTAPVLVPIVVPSATPDNTPPSRRQSDRVVSTPTESVAPSSESPSVARDTVTVWDVPFDRLNMMQSVDAIDRLIERRTPSYVITANLNYCMLNERDEQVRRITADADLILADGQPIVWRSQLGTNRLPERVAGSEMILHLCSRAAEKSHRVFFLGGVEGVAETCAAKLKARYPSLQIAGTECPPFRKLTDAEHAAQLQRIRDAKPDLLFVAFGQPKGEKWIHENYRTLGVPVSIQLGASFDFIAGTATRAPGIYQRCGVEWAYRMLSDPKRLVPRYAANAWYLGQALANDWKRQCIQWGMWPN